MSSKTKAHEGNQFLRPHTRGELRDALKSNIKCEVVSSNVEFTSLMLMSWLEFDMFKTYPSPNVGWTVYEPSDTPYVHEGIGFKQSEVFTYRK